MTTDVEIADLEYRCSKTAERLRSHWDAGSCTACYDLSAEERAACRLDMSDTLANLQDLLQRYIEPRET